MSVPPEQPYRGGEFPRLEEAPQQPDPYAPIDYPTGYPPLPPPVYPPAATYPGYPPYDPYRPGKPLGTNGKAIGALVASLAGLMFCGLPSIAGLILGIIAMRECRRTGQDGYGLALAGTIVGAVVTALIALYLIFVIAVTASGFSYAP
ncbi:DUF4190 domain-containing protein [Mycobacterium sp. 1274761.0]|uniref:DUF4190 domain-containing protein n=1 Tax=Mycobacterium sp. 1274761.0 TaxID=1834077 RepID=UPI0007FF28CC|nr:DUF4190 domain-containing protein [Mycobacterium sp. 1274761.0]OBK75480.1 hypothetical protein A5651_07360 [Mycobacterium sp. 1274761.0]